MAHDDEYKKMSMVKGYSDDYLGKLVGVIEGRLSKAKAVTL